MAITSADINNQSFSIDRKGYDVDEVDVFLEHVADEIDYLNDEKDQHEASSLERSTAAATPASKTPRKPASSMASSAAMVVPPGLQID